jgi:hypothetical protein
MPQPGRFRFEAMSASLQPNPNPRSRPGRPLQVARVFRLALMVAPGSSSHRHVYAAAARRARANTEPTHVDIPSIDSRHGHLYVHWSGGQGNRFIRPDQAWAYTELASIRSVNRRKVSLMASSVSSSHTHSCSGVAKGSDLPGSKPKERMKPRDDCGTSAVSIFNVA